jgi:hypothetical protein
MQNEQLEMELRVEKRRRELRRRVPMGEAQWWFEQMRRAANIASDMANKNATDGTENLASGELCAVGR